MFIMIAYIVKIKIIISIVLVIVIIPVFSVSGEECFRGLWITSSSLFSKNEIDEVIRTAEEKKFNNLVIQVRARGDAYYRSDVVPIPEEIKITEFDPLEYFISEAHKRDIKVHAWFNVFILWSSPSKPKNKDHIFYLRPDWFCKSYNELITNSVNLNSSNEIVFISPGIKSVQEYLLSVFNEVIERYDVDGIHLDYIRYPGENFGYCDVLKKNFYLQYNYDPLQIEVQQDDLINSLGEEGYLNLKEKWNNFRAKHITDLVNRLKIQMNRKKASLVLSAAVIPNIYRARNIFFQYWDDWINKGYVDFVIPMNYEISLKTFKENAEYMVKYIDNEKIVMGVSAYNQNKYKIASKIFILRSMGINSFCIFSYNDIKNTPDIVDLF